MKSDKLVVIRDYRTDRSGGATVGMGVITASNGKADENPEKYAIYNKKWINIYEFAMGIQNKTSISIELYDATIVK